MADIAPFSGKGRFWRGNIHTHSNLSDGALEPGQVIDAYQRAGYKPYALDPAAGEAVLLQKKL